MPSVRRLDTSRRLGPLLAASLALIGCSGDKTSILVEVTSEFEVPGQVDALEFIVDGDGGTTMARDYPLESGFPHTVSLRPGQLENANVEIAVTASLGGAFVARRRVRSAFVPGEEIVVRIDIPASCAGVMCSDTEDCRDGTCVALAPVDGGMDSGPTDSGSMDSGVDAGCTMGTQCDDDVACTVDTCEDGLCRNEPDDGLCEVGTTCDLVDGCPPRMCENDAQCGDGVMCNGSETCTAMACTPGTPVDCNDGDTCTSDRCDEAMRGACVHTTIDVDGDGFGDSSCPESGGVAATDCNDGNPDINPMAPEMCNGLDDDCAGGCDDPFTCCRGEVGPCSTSCGTTGTRVCGTACSWGVCSPPAEVCNGMDDDCNGADDDVFACVQGATEACTTACGSSGTRTCAGDCTWSACNPPAETCNGADDDCDSTTDEGFGCVSGTMTSCTTSCGSTGARTCSAACTLGSCAPPPEGCSGVDDDCDGSIDESAECTPGAMGSCTTSCGSTGSQTCGALCTYGTCNPPAEVCNGADDDCDGMIDDGFACVPGSVGACSTACGTGGTRTCTAGCTWGACNPPIEACNGSDDDCDTMCDETFACCSGSSGSCTTSCGSTGSRTCDTACGWSVCSPPAETCNGNDDDCNGACDDGFGCCAGSTGSCTTVCGSTGSRTCSSGCSWGSCSAPAETCNGLDDDCDSTVDEGFACVTGSSESCTTSCGSTGLRTCNASCSWASCVPPTESCNGVDDDCDGTTDEGCGACSGCVGALGVSAPGGRYTVPLGSDSQSGSCGGSGGSEGYLTFTLAATSDVFITTHHAGSVDTVLYVRDCTCSGPELGCNDNGDGLSTSVLRLTALAAGTYNVIVDTKTSMSGSIPVDLYISTPGAASDRCGNPSFIPAGASTVSGNTCAFGSDYDPVANTGCPYVGSGHHNDRVYYFYVPTSRTVTFDGCVSGTTFDATTYYRTICTSTSVAAQPECNDDGCGGMPSCTAGNRPELSATLGPGLYYFFADGYLGVSCECGDYSYDISGL